MTGGRPLETMDHACGCRTAPCKLHGVLENVRRCDTHRPHPEREYTLAHYESLGAIKDGYPQHHQYCSEFIQAFGDLMPMSVWTPALEIGCGLGMHAPLFLRKRYAYEALDSNPAACRFVRGTFGSTVYETSFEAFQPRGLYHVIIAAHVFEHFIDAPTMMAKACSILDAMGRLYVIIPDDTDLLNPDHHWFFNESNLVATLLAAGFREASITFRRPAERETFLYCLAVK